MANQDAQRIADAFIKIYQAAQEINIVLLANDALNDGVPANWPLSLSADEFATEAWAMAEHYQALAKA